MLGRLMEIRRHNRTGLLQMDKEADNENITGFLSGEDMKKLRGISFRTPSAYRKTSYNIWNCAGCGHSFHYAIIRCPACESSKIEQTTRPTQYEFNEEFDPRVQIRKAA